MKYSKIEIVDRLRKLALWDEASLIKDEFKNRFVSEGMPRKVAREKAWQEIERVFELEYFECYDAAAIAAGAEFPPSVDESIANQPGEPQFRLIWRLWHFTQARRECSISDSSEALNAMNDRITLAGIDSGDIETARLALGDEKRFLRLAISKFLAVIQRLKTTGNHEDDQTVSTLDEQIDQIFEFMNAAAKSLQVK